MPITRPQPAAIRWDEAGTPVATAFGDPYFMPGHGLAETRHVFLAGNGLPGRFRPGFRIAELGVGTGLNLLAAWQAWLDAGIDGPLSYTGFEAFPMTAEDRRRALAAFPELAALADRMLSAWAAEDTGFVLPGLRAEFILGDARDTLPVWTGRAEAWFLDGFAPTKNPELWQPELMAAVARHTEPGGSFATYTAAGHVRRALAAAGFTVDRPKGFGRKRHMSAGTLA
jgi:tRNA U34 5-methylaminomethyl-2-thiouridine-forming methyltransferase MnmC